MPNKVLFLDFDGVLHPTNHGSALFSQVDLLEKALENEACQIVISSSWRFHVEIEDIKKYFSKSIRDQILGVTGEAYIGSYARFHEIHCYVETHGVEEWRALDDTYWEFPKDCGNLIRCNPNTGITEVEMKHLRSWLGSLGG
jgi:hypothetical protein